MTELYNKVAHKTSKFTTNTYTTSFSFGISFFAPKLRGPIYDIYGFVRLADEIVDTFHHIDKRKYLAEFREETHRAVQNGFSLNPILHSFQTTVNRFGIEKELIDTFLDSMEMDLDDRVYDKETYDKYILGSAEVVGLMCLNVFLDGDKTEYEKLQPFAMKLGSAFQKINFLRDLKADYQHLGRSYFPSVNLEVFNEQVKNRLILEIESDFHVAYTGIKMLPKTSRLGVWLAYVYFYALLRKIKRTQATRLLRERIRIPNSLKFSLMAKTLVRYSFNLM